LADGVEVETEAELPLYALPRWLGIAGMAGAGTVVFFAIVLSASTNRGDPSAGAAALAAQTPESASSPTQASIPEAPSAPDIFQLVVQVTPSSALITIDGTAVDSNPFRALYPKAGEPHRVTASADGYESKSEDVSMTSDVTVDFDLKKSFSAFENPNPPAFARPPQPPPARPPAEAGDPREPATRPVASGDTSEPSSE
jgi:PEGA domain